MVWVPHCSSACTATTDLPFESLYLSRMANIGKMSGTLENVSCSAIVEIGGANWILYREDPHYEFICTVGNGTTVLWDCTARGKLTVRDSGNREQFLPWSTTFDFRNMVGPRHLEFPHCDNFHEKVEFEAEVEIVEIRIFDLSAPPNKTIESPKDAACFEVEDEKLWVSKEVLSFRSPFFKAMFSSDFKEKATGCYALKGVDIDDFKLFLSVLYDIAITITTQKSLEVLLRLADMWQCNAVRRFCRHFLRGSESTFLPLRTKIELCDRYAFCSLLGETIRNAKLEDLKKLTKKGCFAGLSSFAHCLIESRLVNSE